MDVESKSISETETMTNKLALLKSRKSFTSSQLSNFSLISDLQEVGEGEGDLKIKLSFVLWILLLVIWF